MSHTRETAEVLGLQVLGWLAGNDELLPFFQGSTGASEQDIKAGAHDAVFLGAVMDFVMMDDAWVLACCEAIGQPNDALTQARSVLPGGEQVNWT